MKKLSAVAVAVCLCASASFAGFDYFTVIESGSGEAKVGYSSFDGLGLNVRYGLIKNLELYSGISGIPGTSDTAESKSDFVLGARYQIIPKLGGFLDFTLPTVVRDNLNNDFGVRPGVNFSTNFTEALSFGSVASLGITPADVGKKDVATLLDLTIGVEFDYLFSENICGWLGVDFVYDDLGNEKHKANKANSPNPSEFPDREFDAAAAFKPSLGFNFTSESLTIGTSVGLKFDHKIKGKDAVGGWGGVDFAIKF